MRGARLRSQYAPLLRPYTNLLKTVSYPRFCNLYVERSVDTRVAIIRVLAALPTTDPHLSTDIANLLAQSMAKETNDIATSALIDSFLVHQSVGLRNDIPMDEKSLRLVNSGLVDKRSRVKTAWALAISDLIWNITSSSTPAAAILTFTKYIAKNLLQIFKESTNNPLQALQNGTISSVYAIGAVSLGRWLTWGDDQIGTSISFSKSDG